jgi:hypothetical protein
MTLGRRCIYIKAMRLKSLTSSLRSGPSWEHHHFADEAPKEPTQDLLASAGCVADGGIADALAKVKQIIAKTP